MLGTQKAVIHNEIIPLTQYNENTIPASNYNFVFSATAVEHLPVDMSVEHHRILVQHDQTAGLFLSHLQSLEFTTKNTPMDIYAIVIDNSSYSFQICSLTTELAQQAAGLYKLPNAHVIPADAEQFYLDAQILNKIRYVYFLPYHNEVKLNVKKSVECFIRLSYQFVFDELPVHKFKETQNVATTIDQIFLPNPAYQVQQN